jgi:hypothetical protein
LGKLATGNWAMEDSKAAPLGALGTIEGSPRVDCLCLALAQSATTGRDDKDISVHHRSQNDES